jgi:hypothetical protein
MSVLVCMDENLSEEESSDSGNEIGDKEEPNCKSGI